MQNPIPIPKLKTFFIFLNLSRKSFKTAVTERKKERSKELVKFFKNYFKLETPPETINFITSVLLTPLSGLILSLGTRKTLPETL